MREPTDDRGDADVGHHFEGKRRTKNDTGVAAGQIVRKQGQRNGRQASTCEGTTCAVKS